MNNTIKSLDQKRAEFAWQKVKTVNNSILKEYTNIAKGSPALVMDNGLMQVLAFYQNKNDAAKKLNEHILEWITKRNLIGGNSHFKDFMNNLAQVNSDQYMQITTEALEILKWIRHFASTLI